MKKLSLLMCSSLLAIGVAASVGPIVAANAEGEPSALQTLVNKYIGAEGKYTKKTTIGLNDAAREDYKSCFHCELNESKRTTYYNGQRLLLADPDGNVRSGDGSYYFADGNIARQHATENMGKVINWAKLSEDDFVQTTGAESLDDEYVSLYTFAKNNYFEGWSYADGVYSLAIADPTTAFNEGTVWHDFLDFCAPMLYATSGQYLTASSLEVAERSDADENNYLELTMKLASIDSSKLAEPYLAQAKIYKDSIVDFSETSAVTLDNVGVVLYASATDSGDPVAITGFTAKNSEGTDVTSTVIRKYESKDKSLSYDYFQAADEGVYTVTAVAADGTKLSKEINVNSNNTNIYGWSVDKGSGVYQDKIIIGKDGTVIYKNVSNTDIVCKMGRNIPLTKEWTFEFKVTDMTYTGQGKFCITESASSLGGQWTGWEDIALGGKPNNDLWAYEANVIGSGWNTYQWRSNWQNPTTEFMPDPNDHTKGCGRDFTAYAQYGTGTHSYKIHASVDEGTGAVTYNFYIDNEIEVVHHTAASHNDVAATDFFQIASTYFNGIISEFKIY